MTSKVDFKEGKSKTKTRRQWKVLNKSSVELGLIKWYAPWRQYCFFPEGEMVFSSGCLSEVAAFIESHKDDEVWPLGGLRLD